ncbi:MAG: ABC transporter permease [Bacteroidales bacterium]|jgi:putative ABC transport system permease protein|nr:ABC transporter permease [Bacteroidales bacterium]MDD2688197.1 ABC transporter permease [Bacteroidales bacterium]MDD3330769.1 ABC transporter permease [Bacteroidales bacterium]MDD3691381.1 ABC transporter permease [Bacteroidales bacterium]MDD4045306.1 ABC transporter permease [Bacteroidales bacterium]
MFDIDIYKEIWQTISRNKMRSFLTGFGVAWGVFMFVVMLGIGNGFNNGMQQNVDGISQNSMFVFSNATTVEYKGFNPGRFWSMNNEDIDILQENIPEIEYISGMMFSNQGGNTVREERSENYNFRGIDHNHTKIEKLNVLQGRTFNYLDIKEKRKNCIIGKQVYEQLFKPGETAIGEQLSVNGLYYIVIGVVNGSENMNIGGDANTSVFIPLSTMQQVNNAGNDIHMIGIAAYDDVNIKNIEQRVKDLLKAKHNIAPTDDAAVNAFNIQEMFLMFKYLFLGIQILTWIVGMGTLLAGVVGISNIMLVSIRERTNEIGIRRALGARPKTILSQIMSESLLLTFVAGYSGFFLGVLLLTAVEKVTQMNDDGMSMFANPQISFGMGITALLILIVSGLIAGIIPAKSALRIKAIDALRDE